MYVYTLYIPMETLWPLESQSSDFDGQRKKNEACETKVTRKEEPNE